MIEGKTRTGFKFKINENALKDWEYLTHLSNAQKQLTRGDEGVLEMFGEFDWLLSFLLKEDKEKLFEHIRKNNDGYLPSDVVAAEWMDISGAGKLKNSQSSHES